LKKGIFSGSAMGKFCVAINCVDPFGMLCTKPKTPAWFFLFYSASLTKVGLTVDPFWMPTKPKTYASFFLFYSASLTKVGLTALILFGMPCTNPKTHASFFLFYSASLTKNEFSTPCGIKKPKLSFRLCGR
jgi:hypothetical protein